MKVNQNEGTKKLYVGVGELQILGFNPLRSELDELLRVERDKNYEPKEEFEYVKTDQELKTKDADGNETSVFCNKLTVTAWVKEVSTGNKYPVNFSLYDVDDVSSTGKFRYVNQHGKSIYCDSEENLSEYFTNTPGKNAKPLQYRKAFKGEANLLGFLAAWTNINPFDTESSLFPENPKKFWQGDMKELNSLVKDFSGHTVMANFTVTSKEVTDDEGNTTTVENNRIETKAFCSGQFMKFFRTYAKNNFEGLTEKSKIGQMSMYNLVKFLDNSFGEYGSKNFSIKGELTEYQQGMNPVNADSSVVDTDASY